MNKTLQTAKQVLRQQMLAEREQTLESERARMSRSITARIAEMAPYRSAKMVLAYMNFGAEFESEALVRKVLAGGKALLLPKVN
ncbi:MAG: 5-formyltetrahydrofolate cyclo-ligase, partial [Gallionellaceae bacterium]|nr:5-formyltetrahydrofolate cyclo-ligase [Gallionellaceae bacterium]